MKKMGVTPTGSNVRGFAEPQKEFLEFHRTNVFLKRETVRMTWLAGDPHWGMRSGPAFTVCFAGFSGMNC
jgi:hypothetical protein